MPRPRRPGVWGGGEARWEMEEVRGSGWGSGDSFNRRDDGGGRRHEPGRGRRGGEGLRGACGARGSVQVGRPVPPGQVAPGALRLSVKTPSFISPEQCPLQSCGP